MSSIFETIRLCYGLPGIPTDERSADRGNYETLDFVLDDADTGISIADSESNEWTPNIADLAAIERERQQTGRETVEEGMSLVITHGTYKETAARVKRLLLFGQRAKEYHDTDYQFEPVYIELKAREASLSQYALIYSMRVDAPRYMVMADGKVQATVGLTIVREAFWRGGVRPGENPIKFAWWVDGNDIETLPYDVTPSNGQTPLWLDPSVGPSILSNNDSQWENRTEYNTNISSLRSQNYITIPGEDIPGDAPAKVMLNFDDMGAEEAVQFTRLHIARRTGRPSITGRGNYGGTDTTPVPLRYMFNAPDSTIVAGSIVVDANGLVPYSSVSGNRVVQGTAGGISIVWNDYSGVFTRPIVNGFMSRGKHNVFVRYRSNAAIDVGLTFFEPGYAYYPFSQFTLPSTGGSSLISLYHIGVVDVPLSDPIKQRVDGTGLQNQNRNDTMPRFWINFTSTDDSSTVFVYDLVFIPFDESYTVLETLSQGSVTARDLNYTVYDATGYLSRGRYDPEAVGTVESTLKPGTAAFSTNVIGQPLTLQPGVDNNLIFLIENGIDNNIRADARTRVNIVPRWRGLVDI